MRCSIYNYTNSGYPHKGFIVLCVKIRNPNLELVWKEEGILDNTRRTTRKNSHTKDNSKQQIPSNPHTVMLVSLFHQTWGKDDGKEVSPTFTVSKGCFWLLNHGSTYFTNKKYIEIRGSLSGHVKHDLQCTDKKIRPFLIQLHWQHNLGKICISRYLKYIWIWIYVSTH